MINWHDDISQIDLSWLKKFLSRKEFYEYAFIAGILVSFSIWLAGIFIEGAGGRQFELFFCKCQDFFADTLNVIGYSAERDPYNNMLYTGPAEKAYPPLVYLFFYILSRAVNMGPYLEMGRFLTIYHESQFLIIFVILLILQSILVYELFRTCKTGNNFVKIGCALCLIVSGPMLFSIERANTIIITMFFVGIYLFLYDSQNKVYREIALLSLAIAAGIKMTPAILGLLLIHKKQWKEALRAIVYGLLFFFVPFFFLKGGINNIWIMLDNLKVHADTYSILDGCTLVADLWYCAPFSSYAFYVSTLINQYLVCGILLISFMYFENKWELLMAISLILVIAPTHSGAYCVLFLFPPIIAFLNAEKHDMIDLLILVACFCIMNSIQNNMLMDFFNYHMGIILITIAMMVKGIRVIRKHQKMKTK